MRKFRFWSTVLTLWLGLSVAPVWAQFNTAPTAYAGPDQLVAPLSFVTLDGSLSNDLDGDPLTYSWLQLLGDPVTLSDPTAAITTFTAPATGQLLSFQLTVTDPFLEFTSDTMNVTVTAVPVPAAAWLFGSGLLGILGLARRRKSLL